MKIALVCDNATALSRATTGEPATEETRVAALAGELARQQHDVTVYARKDAATLPARAELPGGATIRYVAAGPAEPLADENTLPHIRSFADGLAELWHGDKPDVVHAIGWTGGLAALAATRDRSIPVVQTFHSLRAAERRHHIGSDGSTLAEHAAADSGARDRLERAVARSADLSSRPTTTKCPTWPAWACRGPASACCRSAWIRPTSARKARSPRAVSGRG